MTLSDLRKKANLTQAELSKLTGLSIKHLSLLEHGKRNPSDKTKMKLAKALRCQPVDIFLIFNRTKCSKNINLERR